MNIFDKVDKYKKEIDEQRPFDGAMLEQIYSYYRIDLTWSSNALEGNTLSLSETKILLEDGLTVAGKPIKDYYEATGHADAYDYMFDCIKSSSITENIIKKLHKNFYNNIDKSNAGKYRNQQVFVTGSKYPVSSVEKIESDMQELERWAEDERSSLHPVVFAALLHKKFVFIHPFVDGNGRVARLLMNMALLQDGYLLAVIPPIVRREYIDALEKAHKDDSDFKSFICERVVESEKDYARLLGILLNNNNKKSKVASCKEK